MNVKTVPYSVDTSAKLQAVIDSVGNVPTIYDFQTSKITVNSPIKIYGNTTFKGNGVLFSLANNVNPNIFKVQVPVIGTKLSSGTNNIEIFDVNFFGNADNQTATPDRNGVTGSGGGSRLGMGYHNFIGINNSSNIFIHDISVTNSLGDGSRLTNVKKARWYNNVVIGCGHDAFYVDGGSDIESWNNYVELRTNSAVRYRHVIGGYIHDNIIINKVGGKASSPGIQIEVSLGGSKCQNIRIENNEIYGTNGPGIWIIGWKTTDKTAAKGVSIKNNLFNNCGNMASEGQLPGVGGVMCDGFDDVDFSNNTFVGCKGYGIGFGQYAKITPSVSELSAKVYRNIFINTVKANYPGTASGSPVADVGGRYSSVLMDQNCTYNNVANPYDVIETNTLKANPKLDADFNVTEGSPCNFDGYQYGKATPENAQVFVKCERQYLQKVSDYIKGVKTILEGVE